MLRKIISMVLIFGLCFQQASFAQLATELNLSGYLARMHSAMAIDKFRPMHLRYFNYDLTTHDFKVLVDKGDVLKGLSPQDAKKGLSPQGTDPQQMLKDETKTLLNYFLVGVALNNESFWVNLRPDSENQIIDNYLAQTDVGKIMLEADLQLKKDTARLTSPETPEGKEYWNRLYKKAEELFGYDNVSIPTLTRPWIVPGEIIIHETDSSAYIYKATLKVMLEQDYLKDSSQYNFKDPRQKAMNDYSSELIRELIIPKLTKEVNSSKRYANIRQVYYSLILSRWFKNKFADKKGLSPQGTVPDFIDRINTLNLTGLTSKEPWSKTTYFKAYQKSFKDGEYNIKEPVYTPTGQVIRSYFSGGLAWQNMDTGNGLAARVAQVLPRTQNTAQMNFNADGRTISNSSPISEVYDSARNLAKTIAEKKRISSDPIYFALRPLAKKFLNDFKRFPTFNEAQSFWEEFIKDANYNSWTNDEIGRYAEVKANQFVRERLENIPKVVSEKLKALGDSKLRYIVNRTLKSIIARDKDLYETHFDGLDDLPNYRNNRETIDMIRALPLNFGAPELVQVDHIYHVVILDMNSIYGNYLKKLKDSKDKRGRLKEVADALESSLNDTSAAGSPLVSPFSSEELLDLAKHLVLKDYTKETPKKIVYKFEAIGQKYELSMQYDAEKDKSFIVLASDRGLSLERRLNGDWSEARVQRAPYIEARDIIEGLAQVVKNEEVDAGSPITVNDVLKGPIVKAFNEYNEVVRSSEPRSLRLPAAQLTLLKEAGNALKERSLAAVTVNDVLKGPIVKAFNEYNEVVRSSEPRSLRLPAAQLTLLNEFIAIKAAGSPITLSELVEQLKNHKEHPINSFFALTLIAKLDEKDGFTTDIGGPHIVKKPFQVGNVPFGSLSAEKKGYFTKTSSYEFKLNGPNEGVLSIKIDKDSRGEDVIKLSNEGIDLEELNSNNKPGEEIMDVLNDVSESSAASSPLKVKLRDDNLTAEFRHLKTSLEAAINAAILHDIRLVSLRQNVITETTGYLYEFPYYTYEAKLTASAGGEVNIVNLRVFYQGQEILVYPGSAAGSPITTPVVTGMIARTALDSRAAKTIEFEVALRQNDIDYIGSAKVPAGASTGMREAWINPDFVTTANFVVIPRLYNAIREGKVDITSQKSLANWLKALDREMGGSTRLEKLGGNVVLAVCWAFAYAVAKTKGLPLYQYWRQEYGKDSRPYSPEATYNILNAGAHGSATTKVDTQETQFVFLHQLTAASQNAIAAEVNKAMKDLLKKKGLVTTNGDEGGYSPEAISNMQYVQYLLEAVNSIKNGPVWGKDIAIAFDFASTGFYDIDTGLYYLQGESGPIDLLKGLGPTGQAYFKKLVDQGVLRDTTIGKPTGRVKHNEKWINAPGIQLQKREWLAYVQYMMLRAPVWSLEDVCAENDWWSIRQMTRLLEEDRDFYEARTLEHQATGFYNGRRVWHLGDDSITSNPDYAMLALEGSENTKYFTRVDAETIKVNRTGVLINLKELGAPFNGQYFVQPHTLNAFLLKFNQIGTPDDTFNAAEQALKRGALVSFSHRSGSAGDWQFIHGAYVATTFKHGASTNPNILPELKDGLPRVNIKAGNITRERVLYYHATRERVERSLGLIQEQRIGPKLAASSSITEKEIDPVSLVSMESAAGSPVTYTEAHTLAHTEALGTIAKVFKDEGGKVFVRSHIFIAGTKVDSARLTKIDMSAAIKEAIRKSFGDEIAGALAGFETIEIDTINPNITFSTSNLYTPDNRPINPSRLRKVLAEDKNIALILVPGEIDKKGKMGPAGDIDSQKITDKLENILYQALREHGINPVAVKEVAQKALPAIAQITNSDINSELKLAVLVPVPKSEIYRLMQLAQDAGINLKELLERELPVTTDADKAKAEEQMRQMPLLGVAGALPQVVKKEAKAQEVSPLAGLELVGTEINEALQTILLDNPNMQNITRAYHDLKDIKQRVLESGKIVRIMVPAGSDTERTMRVALQQKTQGLNIGTYIDSKYAVFFIRPAKRVVLVGYGNEAVKLAPLYQATGYGVPAVAINSLVRSERVVHAFEMGYDVLLTDLEKDKSGKVINRYENPNKLAKAEGDLKVLLVGAFTAKARNGILGQLPESERLKKANDRQIFEEASRRGRNETEERFATQYKGVLSRAVLAGDYDLIDDASPEGIGAVNRELMYDPAIKANSDKKIVVIYQGGEKEKVGDASFSTVSADFEDIADLTHLRQVSCNTTSLSTIVVPIIREIGVPVQLDNTAFRRGPDPGDLKGGKSSITMQTRYHHGPDLISVTPEDIRVLMGTGINTDAAQIGTNTRFHIHMLYLRRADGKTFDKKLVQRIEAVQSRVALVDFPDGIFDSTRLTELAHNLLPQQVIWAPDGANHLLVPVLTVQETDDPAQLRLIYAVPQESIVAPGNINAADALFGQATKDASMAMVNDASGLTGIVQAIETRLSATTEIQQKKISSSAVQIFRGDGKGDFEIPLSYEYEPLITGQRILVVYKDKEVLARINVKDLPTHKIHDPVYSEITERRYSDSSFYISIKEGFMNFSSYVDGSFEIVMAAASSAISDKLNTEIVSFALSAEKLTRAGAKVSFSKDGELNLGMPGAKAGSLDDFRNAWNALSSLERNNKFRESAKRIAFEIKKINPEFGGMVFPEWSVDSRIKEIILQEFSAFGPQTSEVVADSQVSQGEVKASSAVQAPPFSSAELLNLENELGVMDVLKSEPREKLYYLTMGHRLSVTYVAALDKSLIIFRSSKGRLVRPFDGDWYDSPFGNIMKELAVVVAKEESANPQSQVDQKKVSGSPLKAGGIDFRSLPMTIKPMGSFEGLNLRLPQISSSALMSFDLNREIEQLNQMVSNGIIPSGARVQELVAAAWQKGKLQDYQTEILTILAEICKLQEGECCESSDELKVALVAANAV